MFFLAKVHCSNLRVLKKYNINILLKFLVFNAISVTKTFLVLFSMFSNANQQGKALNFDIVQIKWPPSWISTKGMA